MNGARVFFVGGVISYRALFGFMSPWIFVPVLVVTPFFQILLFAYVGRSAGFESDEFYVIGNALQYASVPCLFAMTQIIAGERFQQTLGYILVSPAPRLPLFLGRAGPVIANGFFTAAFAMLLGGIVLDVDVPANALAPIALVTAVSAFSLAGLGLLAAALGFVLRENAVLSNILFGLLLVFTGANVPVDELPGWMAFVGRGMPLTHGIEAARALADERALGDVAGLVAREAAIGMVYLVGGYVALRLMETQSRKHATLERS